jgi:hypothetical protein
LLCTIPECGFHQAATHDVPDFESMLNEYFIMTFISVAMEGSAF